MENAVDLSDFVDAVKKGPRCTVGVALSKLEGERLEKALSALDAPEIRHNMIATRLSEWTGERLGATTVGRHRRKECLCD